MLQPILLAVIGQGSISADINRCLNYLEKTASTRVQIQSTETESGKKIVQAIDFSKMQGKGMRYTVLEPAQGRWDRQHQQIFVSEGKATVVDRITSNYLVLDIPKLPDPTQSLRMAGLTVPEPVSFFLDPSQAKSVLGPMAQASGWKVRSVGPIKQCVLQSGSAKSANRAELRFDRSGRLTLFSLKSPQKEVAWQVTYRNDVQSPKAELPKRSVRVTSFVERLAQPAYSDAQARKYGAMAFEYFDKLIDAQVVFRDDNGTVRLTVAGPLVMEEAMNYAWAFDGRELTVQAHSKELYGQGKLSQRNIARSLQRFYIEPKLLSQRLLARENFLRAMLPPLAKLRSAGSVKVNGEDLAVLEAKFEDKVIQLSIKKKDGALVDLTSRTYDRKGKVQTTSRYGFQFSQIGKTAPISAFRLKNQRGYRTVAL